ncbi:unnamed protein product [Pleuronectes platessa]|uniref:Uncharacterized protein n=1 Tax=Pleuronectes platessa TaxID=8262 RepID=A0A9N7V6J7_PLEPL|nr:unnamed protein product [Pleuronectes platessa]
MRNCEGKLPQPVEALGEASKQRLFALALADGVLGCVRVMLTSLTISWLRGEMSAVHEKEGAPKTMGITPAEVPPPHDTENVSHQPPSTKTDCLGKHLEGAKDAGRECAVAGLTRARGGAQPPPPPPSSSFSRHCAPREAAADPRRNSDTSPEEALCT